jgi:Integrase core domain
MRVSSAAGNPIGSTGNTRFLRNHLPDLAAIDMFVVATATFQLLYTFIVLSHDRRRVVHFEVTRNPTQVWLSGQMTEAFPWETTPRYLLRDRDNSYGPAFRHRVRAMGITEVITAPRSPWQNPYVERLIGSIRRECLDHVIILSERHLRRVLSSYFQYHHEARTHLSLNKDCPCRPVQLPSAGITLRPSHRSAACIIAMSVEPREMGEAVPSCLSPTICPQFIFEQGQHPKSALLPAVLRRWAALSVVLIF